MWAGRKASDQRSKFLESLKKGLKEQEEKGGDSRFEEWETKSKIITEREEYVEHMKTQIEEWNTDIDQLEDKSSNSGADLKEKADVLIGKLDQKLAEGQETLKNIAGTTDDSWVDLKADAEVIWKSIKTTVEETRKTLG